MPASFRRPLLGQVQRPVEQGPPLGRRVPEEHAHLGVLDPPGRTGVLAGHPARLRPLLQEPGLVHDQHTVRLAQVLGNVAKQVVADGFGVPIGTGKQVLHPVRCGLAQVLGHLPPVLPLGVTQQRPHIANSSLPRFAPGEMSANPIPNGVHLRRPLNNIINSWLPCHRLLPPLLGKERIPTTAVGLGTYIVLRVSGLTQRGGTHACRDHTERNWLFRLPEHQSQSQE